MNSIQSRLTAGLLISLTIVFLILWLTVSSNIQKYSEDYIASRLEHDVETLLTAITFDDKETLVLNEKYISKIYHRPFSGHYYTIQHNNDLFRSRSLWDTNLTSTNINGNNYVKSIQKGPENQTLIIISRHFKKHNQDFTIIIAEDLSPVIDDISQFKNYFTFLSLFILISLLFIQIIILRKELKPLRKIHNELNQIEKGTISKLTTDVPTELEPVVKEINNLSLAIYNRLKRSRNALSDLSHAIKKPLTMLHNFSDEHKDRFNPEENKFLSNQISSIQNITDRILKRARVAGTTKFNSPFNLNEDLTILIKTIQMMYPNKHVNVTSELPIDLEIVFDRDDMLELLGNLLENAWKWASSEISIKIEKERNLSIIIEDDGPGADEQSLNELSKRGVRLDESVSGYGFGLAISADIVKDYEGELQFSRSEKLGGFKAKIQLPI